eukprot:CAMPEP_0182418048 /NCGR_PEP_ID=MMETSP1167-20130531/2504_1 /TAXON_ID=2988 /ORGANISM="Mallomonas Sp, Strain CCMP3275" /LENGTH=203 /DNA_ID=CAMNT_0024592017 /DNA_START=1169 /DNA_END=1780 /DNA_ORIENTATION=-
MKVISAAVCTVFVCYAESPEVFMITHPESYRELVSAWRRCRVTADRDREKDTEGEGHGEGERRGYRCHINQETLEEANMDRDEEQRENIGYIPPTLNSMPASLVSTSLSGSVPSSLMTSYQPLCMQEEEEKAGREDNNKNPPSVSSDITGEGEQGIETNAKLEAGSQSGTEMLEMYGELELGSDPTLGNASNFIREETDRASV